MRRERPAQGRPRSGLAGIERVEYDEDADRDAKLELEVGTYCYGNCNSSITS